MCQVLLLWCACAGARSMRAARAAFRPQQGRRQMTVVAAADGEECMRGAHADMHAASLASYGSHALPDNLRIATYCLPFQSSLITTLPPCTPVQHRTGP